MAVLKDHYYRLASELPAERLEAATSLLLDLADAGSKDDWDYALNRLLKGLVTTRQSARFGFSMALTETIRELVTNTDPNYAEYSVDLFLDLVMSSTLVKASMKGRDERAVLFGRLFGFQALINSQLLFVDTLVSKDSGIVTKFVRLLVELLSAKSWLRETAVFTLCNFIATFVASSFETAFKSEILLDILQQVNDVDLSLSSEGVAIYLTIPQEMRASLSRMITGTKPTWKNGDPLSRGNLPVLAKALKDTDVVSCDENDADLKKNSKQKGSWSPRVPFVWDLIISSFNAQETLVEKDEISGSSKKRKHNSSTPTKRHKPTRIDAISLVEFWKVVVDESLFSEKASPERKFWGFEILIKFLDGIIDCDEISHLFTPNLLRCLINQSAQPQRMLHKVALKVLDTIEKSCKRNILKAPLIAAKLVDESVGGCWNFDLVSKSKTVDRLLSILGTVSAELPNHHEILIVIGQYKTLIGDQIENAFAIQELDSNGDKALKDHLIRWCLDKMLMLVKNTKHLQANPKLERPVHKLFESFIKTLIQGAFFETPKWKASLVVTTLCRERLNSVLLEIVSISHNGNSWPRLCVNYFEKLLVSSKYSSAIDLDAEIEEVKSEALTILNSIDEIRALSTQASKSDDMYCFELLFSMLLLQLVLGDEEAVLVIGEVRMCYEDTFGGASGEEEDDVRDRATNAQAALTDIILSFSSRKSALLKKLSMIVWESFLCASNPETGRPRVDQESLQLLYNVLEARENKEGQQKLFENDDDFEAEDISGEDDREEDLEKSQTEDIIEGDANKSGNLGSDSELESEDSQSDSSDPEVSENDARATLDKDTNLKLARALGMPIQESGEVKFEDMTSESDNSNSESMDDEQMMAMDDQLSKIFKQRQDALSSIHSGNKRKAEVAEARKNMIFFKSRVLDLVEAFSKAQPNSPLNIAAIKPLLVLIQLTLDKNLANKAQKILKTRISRFKATKGEIENYYAKADDVSQFSDSLLTNLRDIQREAAKAKSAMHLQACQQSSMILARALVSVDKTSVDNVIDVYADLLKLWLTDKKNKTNAALFFDFINWLNSIR